MTVLHEFTRGPVLPLEPDDKLVGAVELQQRARQAQRVLGDTALALVISQPRVNADAHEAHYAMKRGLEVKGGGGFATAPFYQMAEVGNAIPDKVEVGH